MSKTIRFPLLLVVSLILALLAFTGGAGNPFAVLAGAPPLVIVGSIAFAFSITSFLAGWLTGDYSWVDRAWSILPVLYTWVYALRGWPDARLVLMALLVTLWGARLTFNFARKGGYGDMEDYRWAVVRGKITSPLAWQAFSLLFISLYQNLLFVLFTLPAFRVWETRGGTLGVGDLAVAALFVLSVSLETLADQQQWNFQRAKAAARTAGLPLVGDLAGGFLTTGLFRYSRHPNFFFEQANWWIFYLFAVFATGSLIDASVIGALLLTLLFQGSTALTERVSMEKYPAYARYRTITSRIIPWFPSAYIENIPAKGGPEKNRP